MWDGAKECSKEFCLNFVLPHTIWKVNIYFSALLLSFRRRVRLFKSILKCLLESTAQSTHRCILISLCPEKTLYIYGLVRQQCCSRRPTGYKLWEVSSKKDQINEIHFQWFVTCWRTGNTIDLVYFAGNLLWWVSDGSLVALSLTDHTVCNQNDRCIKTLSLIT